MKAALVSAIAGVFHSQPAQCAVPLLFDGAHSLPAPSLHTHAMGNIYGYGASRRIPNKDKSFSLGAASLHPHPFLQACLRNLGQADSKLLRVSECWQIDVTRSTIGCSSGNNVADFSEKRKKDFREPGPLKREQKVSWCWYFKCLFYKATFAFESPLAA